MVDQNCAYCVEGELLAKFGIKICELENSKVYLFKEQSHPGRVVVAHKKHVSEILELTPQERAAYLEEIAKVSEAIHKIFKPAKSKLWRIWRYRTSSAFPSCTKVYG